MSARAAWVAAFGARGPRASRPAAGGASRPCSSTGGVRTYTVGADVALVPGVDGAFWPKLTDAAKALGADPRDWAAVLFSESSIKPTAVNRDPVTKAGRAFGIAQMTLVHFGPGKTVPDVAPEDFLALPASRQLDYVLRLWGAQFRAHPGAVAGGARDLYWLNYKPATYVQGAPDDHVITPGPKPTDPRAQEAAILYEPDGSIRAGSLVRFLKWRQGQEPARWNQVVSALASADTGGGGLASLPQGGPSTTQAAAGAGGLVVALGIFGFGLYLVSRKAA